MVAIKETLFSFSPLALAQVRALFTALLFGILFLVFGRPSSLRLSRRQWLYFVLMALCGITIGQILFIRAISLTSVPHAALIVGMEPIMVLILSVLMRLEPLTLLKALGMAISFSGVVVLTFARSAQGSHAHWLGDVILLVQILIFSFYTILMKGVADQHDALTLNTMVFWIGRADDDSFWRESGLAGDLEADSIQVGFGPRFYGGVLIGGCLSAFRLCLVGAYGLARCGVQLS